MFGQMSESDWTTMPCRTCGTDVRVAVGHSDPKCSDCRDAEIRAYYADKDRRYRSGWGAPAPKPYPKIRPEDRRDANGRPITD